MGSKALVFLGLFVAMVLLISSEVTARELAETTSSIDAGVGYEDGRSGYNGVPGGNEDGRSGYNGVPGGNEDGRGGYNGVLGGNEDGRSGYNGVPGGNEDGRGGYNRGRGRGRPYCRHGC